MTNLEPTKWGKVYWNLLHALVDNVEPVSYEAVKNNLIQTIINICADLPKSSCNITNFDVNKLRAMSQDGLRRFMCDIHNEVNRKLGKLIFDYSLLSRYKMHLVRALIEHERYNEINNMSFRTKKLSNFMLVNHIVL